MALRLVALLAATTVITAPAFAEGETVILDTTGVWRLHQAFAPPMIDSPEGPKPLLFGKTWLERPTAAAPADWTNPDFDDSDWLRGPATIASDVPYLSRLCLRGKFLVTDPARVGKLALSVDYRGGVILRVNGREIARRNLPDRIDENTLAEGYPAEAFVDENGGNLGLPWAYRNPSGETKRRIALRARSASDVAIPPALLRKGINVVAIEIVRAPYNRAMEQFRDVFDHPSIKRMLQTKELCTFVELKWPTCAIIRARLAADGDAGLVPNATRPKGLQVWNSSIMASDYDLDFGGAAESLRPIRIAGARNGSFSGEVMVGADETIKGLRAEAGPLTGPGTIPPAALRIRYGIPWGEEAGAAGLWTIRPALLGALSEKPPAEVVAREGQPPRRTGATEDDALTPTPGAVASVWMTVDVPDDAKPGHYAGELTIRADGATPVKVPVSLGVEDWTLADPQNYSTWVELIQSPDTLVEEYGVERWSDEHFRMIAQSMRHLKRIGSRVVYVPAICRTNIGNEESMIRWIRKPDGTFDWDFSVMDRYLDLAAKEMGRTKVVCFWVWEKFMFPSAENPVTYEGDRPTVRVNDNPRGSNDELAEYIGKGPRVTVLDPKSGKLSTEFLPYVLSDESKAIWKPLFVELKKRMERRGWLDAMMLGTPSDVTLRKEHFAFYNEIAPGIPWVSHSHMNHTRIFQAGGARLGYHSTVFNVVFALDPEEGRRHGWQDPDLHAHLLRNWGLDTDDFPMATWRHMAELNIAGSQRGIGHMGADFWSVVKNTRRARVGRIYEKFPEGNWRSNDVCTSVLAPGPDGPVATTRYEMLREGVQECEARIFIERALLDESLRKKIGDDLAARCLQTLDERTRCMIRAISSLQLTGYWRQLAPLATHGSGGWWNKPGIAGNAWFISSGWQERDRTLFALAGEVARKLDAHKESMR